MKLLGTAALSLFISFLLIFSLTGCGGAESLSGRWICEEHYIESMIGNLGFEFNQDGTFVMLPMQAEGTYTIENGKVQLDNQFLGDGLELEIQHKIRLVATAPLGDVVYVKQ